MIDESAFLARHPDAVLLSAEYYPATVGLLAMLLQGRHDFDRLGWRPRPATGTAWVDWDHLAVRAPISSTESGVVLIARGCSILERQGGLSRLAKATIEAVTASIERP